MFLEKFDPASVDPLLLVNRKDARTWLFERLDAYLKSVPPHVGTNFVVIGDKGCGKTILTRAAVRDVRESYSDRVVFIDVNCRDTRTAKAVFGRIALQLVEGLAALRELGHSVKGELIANAQILVALTRFDSDAELKIVHEHIEHYKEAVKLDGKRSFLKYLNASFSISLERSERTVETLSGKIRFDIPRVAEAVTALFEDVRDNGFDVVLYLDNLDELRHEYRTREEIEGVRADIVALPRDAQGTDRPSCSTYVRTSAAFWGVSFHRRVLPRLKDEDMLESAYARLANEPLAAKTQLQNPVRRDAAHTLARMAPAPLTFLTWFHRLVDSDDLDVSRLEQGLENFLSTDYATLPPATLKAVAEAFGDGEAPDPISEEVLLSACRNNEAVMHQVQELQIVLPRDFWNPVEFILDPYLAFLRPWNRTILRTILKGREAKAQLQPVPPVEPGDLPSP